MISILNALYDFASEGNADVHNIRLGDTNLTKLTDTQKMIAVNKGWFLSGYNTVRIPAGMDISGFATDNNVTKVYVELTSENSTSRISELYTKFPNITEVYLFENGTITEAVNIFTGVDNNIKAQITKVVFMEGYFNNVTLDMREYGNLDELPVVWGGFGFDKFNTLIMKIDTTKGGSLECTLFWSNQPNRDDMITDWGDGTIDSEFTHTYAEHGIYRIKTKAYNTNPVSMSGTNFVIEVENIPPYKTNCNYFFDGCTNLVRVTAYNLTLTGVVQMFYKCPNLTEIVGIETWDMSNCVSYRGFLCDCSSITYDTLLQLSNVLDFRNCDSNSASFENMFRGVTFNDAVPLQQLNVSSIRNARYMLCSIKVNGDLDLSMWDMHPTNLYEFMSGANINGAVNFSGWDVSNCTDFNRLLHWSSASSVNLSGWNFSSATTGTHSFIGCPASDWDFTGASGIKFDIVINNPQNHSVNSLVGLFNALYDFASEGNTGTHTCDIGSTNLAKLTDEQIAIATNKGWTVQ